ncbi:MAG: TraR/DksA family transcriptional regulator [Spirochaetales bacterium]|nr:TraR/DksA family transcriptional regulator [Spirochaetales bacterium]
MKAEFTKQMRKALLELKEEILYTLAQESDEFRELIEDKDPKDLVDIATDDIDKRMLEILENQDIKRLNLIEAALSRIENERYGFCMKCSAKIPEDRLKAIPYATLCLPCKSKEERKNR